MSVTSKTVYEQLLDLSEGDSVSIEVIDFANTRWPKEDNPRSITGTVEHVKEDVSRSAGEIQRAIVIDNPYNEGCVVDVGDMRENNLTGGSNAQSPRYTKAWRPRPGKDRLLLGRVGNVNFGGGSK
jgi:hypothetical protein